MMRGYLDRMMGRDDLVLTFHRASNIEAGPLAGAIGLFTTEQALRRGDLERVSQLSLDARELADGQVIKIKR